MPIADRRAPLLYQLPENGRTDSWNSSNKVDDQNQGAREHDRRALMSMRYQARRKKSKPKSAKPSRRSRSLPSGLAKPLHIQNRLANRRPWHRTRSADLHASTVTSRHLERSRAPAIAGRYRRWGVSPRPENAVSVLAPTFKFYRGMRISVCRKTFARRRHQNLHTKPIRFGDKVF